MLPLPYLQLLFVLLTYARAQLNSPLEYHLLEELPRNTLVGNVIMDARLYEQYDSSIVSQLRFRFLTQPELDRAYFSIKEDTGVIRTTGRLDRDLICPRQVDCLLKFDVGVSPIKYFSIIKVVLEVIDINDNAPTFPQREVTFDVSESTIPGTTFVVPAATDLDSSFNGIQEYDLVATSDKFSLRVTNTADGSTDLRLVLKEPLDREIVDHYQVRIIAYDGGMPSKSGSVLVDIAVEDANDNDPVFQNATYEVVVTENLPPGSAIARVKANDPDAGVNGDVVYKFSRHSYEEYGHLFGINSETGEVFVKGVLDYEEANIYLLSLVAYDRGADSLPATSSLVVRVRDSNDNPPHIKLNTLTASGEAQVLENAGIGTFVAHISVTDTDSGENGIFSCAINSDHFRLQKLYLTEYKLVTSAVFDREQLDSYSVPLVCRDKGKQSQTSVHNIHVRVVDENDHAPVFWPPRYSAILEENNPVGAYILKVNATDGDIGPNGKVTFLLDPNAGELVTVEPNSGLITAAIIFDYERIQTFEFQVYAVDGGEPERSATTTIHMTILDHDDEQPKFSQVSYSFGTYENQEPGAEVGRVLAVDADTPPFNSFVYRLDPYHSASDTFEIDSNTGIIYTRKKLDREGQPVYYLTVIADPGDGVMFSSSASVSIYVADRNDNEPVFDFPTVENNTVSLSSRTPHAHVVARLKGHDIDTGSNAKLTFGIIDGNRGNTFAVDPVTGAVAVNADLSDVKLERFYLTVVVRDNGDPQREDYEDLVLVVSSDIPFAARYDPFSMEGDDLVIVLAFGVATLFVVVVIVIAIIVIIRKRNREHRNAVVCDKEMQKMLPTVAMMEDEGKVVATAPISNAYVSTNAMETMKNHVNCMQDNGKLCNGGNAGEGGGGGGGGGLDDHRIIIRQVPSVSEPCRLWSA